MEGVENQEQLVCTNHNVVHKSEVFAPPAFGLILIQSTRSTDQLKSPRQIRHLN